MTASFSSRDLEIQDLCGQLMHDHMRLDDERDALIDEMRALQRQVKRRDSLLPEGFLDLDLYDERVRIMTLSRAITEHEYRIHQLERIELRIVKMFAKEARAQKWMPLIKEEAEEDDPVPDELKTCSSTILNRREEEASSDRALGIEAGNKENVKVGKKSTFGDSRTDVVPGTTLSPALLNKDEGLKYGGMLSGKDRRGGRKLYRYFSCSTLVNSSISGELKVN